MLKFAAIALSFSLLLPVGCTPGATSANPAMRGLMRVRDSHTLRAAYINYPPSMTVDPNTKALGGIMPQVMSEAAKAMGLDLKYTEETTFASMVDSLENEHADVVVSGIWPSSTRALRADFSRVVYYSPVYAYVRSSDARLDGKLASLGGGQLRIATIDGELSSIVARSDFPAAPAVSLPQQSDVAQLLLQLSSNKADVTFVAPAIADAFLAKNPGSIRRVANAAAVRLFPNTFLFRKGDTALRDAVNIALVELTNSKKLSAIVRPFDEDGTRFILPDVPVSP